ncbi:glycosyltransferase family 9 protein [Candidatus Roizmanbacteria bacterium]|nr:glycosyltransferase family 9 protein [Candidatus Roizmanbacteria bacterium]
MKNILPDAVIDFLCIPLTANVLENNTLINNIIKFDKKGKDKLNKLFEVISIVRKNNYHIILTPHRSMRSALITYFSKAPVKIGFDRNSLAFLLTKKVAYDINSHEIQRNLDLLSVIPGIDLDDSKISSKAILNPSEKDMKIVDSLIAQKENIIVFAPCSKWFTKQITISKSIEITKAFIEKSYVVVLIGSGDDFNFCREMERNTNSNIYSSGMGKLVNLCGRLSPLQSYYAINKAKVLITVDSAT